MAITVHFYGEGSRKAVFQDEQGVPSQDFLLLITAGCFVVRFPTLGAEYTAEANQGIFIPKGLPFERRILSPIDYHQFSFSVDSACPYYSAMTAGKLMIPESHLLGLMESFHRAGTLSDGEGVIGVLLEHLFTEQYLSVHAGAGQNARLDADILEVVAYMRAHLSKKLDMDALAARVYLSHTGLIWKFKRQTGKTPLQYLIEMRMELAKELLLTGSLSVTEIAERCGYPNAYSFTNAFHHHTGKSPTAFRKSSP